MSRYRLLTCVVAYQRGPSRGSSTQFACRNELGAPPTCLPSPCLIDHGGCGREEYGTCSTDSDAQPVCTFVPCPECASYAAYPDIFVGSLGWYSLADVPRAAVHPCVALCNEIVDCVGFAWTHPSQAVTGSCELYRMLDGLPLAAHEVQPTGQWRAADLYMKPPYQPQWQSCCD